MTFFERYSAHRGQWALMVLSLNMLAAIQGYLIWSAVLSSILCMKSSGQRVYESSQLG